jgi:hypothetical protein
MNCRRRCGGDAGEVRGRCRRRCGGGAHLNPVRDAVERGVVLGDLHLGRVDVDGKHEPMRVGQRLLNGVAARADEAVDEEEACEQDRARRRSARPRRAAE